MPTSPVGRCMRADRSMSWYVFFLLLVFAAPGAVIASTARDDPGAYPEMQRDRVSIRRPFGAAVCCVRVPYPVSGPLPCDPGFKRRLQWARRWHGIGGAGILAGHAMRRGRRVLYLQLDGD